MKENISKLNYVIHGQLKNSEDGFHTHPVGQLLFAEKGLIHIEYLDRKILLPMQFCSWIPPFKPHRIRSGREAYVRAIYFESEFCKNKIFFKESVFPLSNVLKEMIRYTMKWDGEPNASIYETTFLTAIRQMLPGEMTDLIKLEIPKTSHPRLRAILNFIDDNYHKNIQVETLERLFSISGRTLHRLFTKQLGQSFSAYLMFLRIVKAIEYLLEGNLAIKEVAYAVGYNSIPAFGKIFKAVTGRSPGQFAGKSAHNYM